jgi:hypothetical protein
VPRSSLHALLKRRSFIYAPSRVIGPRKYPNIGASSESRANKNSVRLSTVAPMLNNVLTILLTSKYCVTLFLTAFGILSKMSGKSETMQENHLIEGRVVLAKAVFARDRKRAATAAEVMALENVLRAKGCSARNGVLEVSKTRSASAATGTIHELSPGKAPAVLEAGNQQTASIL